MHKKPTARRIAVSAVVLLSLHCASCMPVDTLRAPVSNATTPHTKFRNGDSLAATAIKLTEAGIRRGLYLIADGQRFQIDTFSGFQLNNGKRFVVRGGNPFLQATSGRINVYSRYVFRTDDTLAAVHVKRLSPFDLLQKLPDTALYHMTSGSLLQMTADNPGANTLAKSFRYYQRRTNATIAAGAALAAAGAVSLFVGALTSDADRDYRRPYYIAGGTAFAVGAGLLTIPLPYFSSRAAHYRNAAINAYNGR